jgi:hypothetical protein
VTLRTVLGEWPEPPPDAPSALDEAGWLNGADPDPLLEYLGRRASERKERLFACACCRPMVGVVREGWCRPGVEVGERYADGVAGWAELRATRRLLDGVPFRRHRAGGGLDPAALAVWALTWRHWHLAARAGWTLGPRVAWGAALWRSGGTYDDGPWRTAEQRQAWERERARQCGLLRCVFGNPFRPLTFNPYWASAHDGAVLRLARLLYEGRRWADLPVLGDALEDAGCQDEGALGHCRGGGEHARGCWVVDLVLGRS